MEKLNAEDPELDALEPFDGVVAYSQEKVRALGTRLVFGKMSRWSGTSSPRIRTQPVAMTF